MDNEPRMQDRSPEGQMFAIESEIKNMMKNYEMAVADGDTDRAQFIADVIDRMQQMIISRQSGIANKMIAKSRPEADFYAGPNMASGGEASFPDLTGDGQVTQADILKGRGVEFAGGGPVGGISPEDNQMIQRAFSTQSNVGETAQMLKNILVKKYPNIPEPQINAILSKGIEDYSKKPPLQGMAEGGEAIGDELAGMAMSQEEAMAEVGNAEKEMAMIQQLVTVVQQLLAEGISEDDLVAFLKEQGLDDEDIDSLMQMVLQSQSEQGPDQIGQELQGMM